MSDKKLEKDTEGGGGEERYLWSLRKQRGLCMCAFPDRGTAKPGGADRTTEITNLIIF
jgi:hypothetical protein